MSVRIIEFFPVLLNSLLRGGHSSSCGGGYETDAPSDINIVDVRWDRFNQKVQFLVESAIYPPILEGESIPSVTIMVTQKSCRKEVV